MVWLDDEVMESNVVVNEFMPGLIA